MLKKYLGLLLCIICSSACAEIETLSMKPAADITLADVCYFKAAESPKAVLVLCPGANGNGLGLIRQKAWQEFAIQENLGLMGIHFESPSDLLCQCQGYYQASKGSGDILLESIRRIFGHDLPILLYGFSGGAHFTTRFIAWKPESILGWCAQGAGVLDEPVPAKRNPPGIMACGADDSRLGGALVFFKQGRAAKKPWLWIEIPKTGHATSANLEVFVRSYFASLLHPSLKASIWVDIDLMKEISEDEANQTPSLSGWLPDRNLFNSWQQFHE